MTLNGGRAMSLPKKVKNRPNPPGLDERRDLLVLLRWRCARAPRRLRCLPRDARAVRRGVRESPVLRDRLDAEALQRRLVDQLAALGLDPQELVGATVGPRTGC